MKKLAMYTGNVPVVEKGEKGATERFRDYGDIPAGELLQKGGDGDSYIDYVVYGDDWYVCIQNHNKDIRYNSPTNTGYWKQVSEQSRIATKLLLATKGFIKNLQVDEVVITDQGEGKGNILLRATKDGIECKQGNFENVKVSGEMRVSMLRYKANDYDYNNIPQKVNTGFIYGGGYYELPKVNDGEFIKIEVVVPFFSRSTIPATLTCEDTNGGFVFSSNNFTQSIEPKTAVYGWVSFVGFSYDGKTIWLGNRQTG